MQVSFIQHREDLRRVQEWLRGARYAQGAVACVMVFTAFAWYTHRDALLGSVMGLVYIAVGWPLLAFRERRKAEQVVDALLAEDFSRIGPRTLRLDWDGIHWGGGGTDTVFPWAEFRGVRRNRHFLFLLMRDRRFVPIPLRAFPRRSDVQLFWNALLAYRLAASEGHAFSVPADEAVWPPPPRVPGK